MRVLRNTHSGPVQLNRRDFLKRCVAFAALGMIPTGLLQEPFARKKKIRGYRRLRPLTDPDLYGTNPYAG
ncbi:MAG: twin-arginine translocation signal domain-containing protein [Deltaproteobacteria bacterium]|nr:twin-arginine translocation signal domain-containing protein [Deltaproteobacteria bacterium]